METYQEMILCPSSAGIADETPPADVNANRPVKYTFDIKWNETSTMEMIGGLDKLLTLTCYCHEDRLQ